MQLRYVVEPNADVPGATTISKYDPAVPSVPCCLPRTPVIASPSARGCPALLASEVSNLYVLSSVSVKLCPSLPLSKYLLLLPTLSSVAEALEVPPVTVSVCPPWKDPVTLFK